MSHCKLQRCVSANNYEHFKRSHSFRIEHMVQYDNFVNYSERLLMLLQCELLFVAYETSVCDLEISKIKKIYDKK